MDKGIPVLGLRQRLGNEVKRDKKSKGKSYHCWPWLPMLEEPEVVRVAWGEMGPFNQVNGE